MHDAGEERPWTHSASLEGKIMTILVEMVTTSWRRPVHVKIGDVASDAIQNSHEALTYLHTRWPAERGLYFEAASYVCERSVAGTATSTMAREAFIAAAIEADIVA